MKQIIFGPNTKEITEGLRKLYGEEIHNFHSSHNVIMLIKTKSMEWVGHVRCMSEPWHA